MVSSIFWGIQGIVPPLPPQSSNLFSQKLAKTRPKSRKTKLRPRFEPNYKFTSNPPKITNFKPMNWVWPNTNPGPHCGKIYSNVWSNWVMGIWKFRGGHSLVNSLKRDFRFNSFQNICMYFSELDVDKIFAFCYRISACVQFGQKDQKAGERNLSP